MVVIGKKLKSFTVFNMRKQNFNISTLYVFHRLSGSSPYSDISGFPLRSPLGAAGPGGGHPHADPHHLASLSSRLQWEQYQRAAMQYSPLAHRNFSPASLSGRFITS